jgi:hypothetical protein
MLIAAQLSPARWGCMLMAAVSAALAIGETGAEGKVVGLVFSALALATFARMAAVAGGPQSCRNTRRCCIGHRWRAGRSRRGIARSRRRGCSEVGEADLIFFAG